VDIAHPKYFLQAKILPLDAMANVQFKHPVDSFVFY